MPLVYRSVHDGPIASVQETRTGRGGYDIRSVRVFYRSEVYGLPQFVTIAPDGTAPLQYRRPSTLIRWPPIFYFGNQCSVSIMYMYIKRIVINNNIALTVASLGIKFFTKAAPIPDNDNRLWSGRKRAKHRESAHFLIFRSIFV